MTFNIWSHLLCSKGNTDHMENEICRNHNTSVGCLQDTQIRVRRKDE